MSILNAIHELRLCAIAYSKCIRIVAGVLLVFCAPIGSVLAEANTLILEDATPRVPGGAMLYLEDAEHGLDIQAVSSAELIDEFKTLSGPVPNFGFSTSAYWLHLRLINQSVVRYWMLQVQYAPLDRIEFYYRVADGPWQTMVTGDTYPFAQRPVKHRTFVFPLEPPRDVPVEIYMRFETEGSMIMPVEAMPATVFYARDHEQQILLGLYYGILLVLTIYNLILYFIVRERAYLFYLFYITGFGLFQMNLNGLSFEYLWPGLPGLNNNILPFSIGWAFLWGLLFIMELIDTKRNTRGLHSMMKLLTVPFLLLIGMNFFPNLISYHFRITYGAGLLIVFGLTAYIVGIRVWLGGYRPARYFVIAWLPFLSGMILYALRAFGVIPSNPFTENAMQFGSAVEMSLLSLGLADRINIIKEEKDRAHRLEQEARLRLVRYQFELLKKSIQPHFILNSLNATSVWLREDPEQAARLLHSLARELRQVLNVVERPTISMGEEVALCRAHLSVMSLRQDCSYTLKTFRILPKEEIPPMLFHTLIENGITHGFRDRKTGSFLLGRLRGRDRIRYILYNDGYPDDGGFLDEGSGTGMRYVQTRLEEIWPGRWSLKAGPFRGGWRVVIDVYDHPRE